MTQDTLEFTSKSKTVTMNYASYSTAIVLQYKVKLVGWTHSKIVSPSEIGSIQDLRVLRDALRSGECKWVRLTKSQVDEYTAELEKEGQAVVKKRKTRSDKGTSRKAKTGGAEVVASTSKRRKLAKDTYSSQEFVDSDSENQD